MVLKDKKKIILTTINAKWIHPSLALRLLKANLGPLEDSCEIIEFALRQPLAEKLEPLLAAFASSSAEADDCVCILGISVSIWNHLAVIELLEELNKTWSASPRQTAPIIKPVIVFGGPEVSYLPPDSEIFKFADYVIRGEGETAFRLLCEDILQGEQNNLRTIINAEHNNLNEIKSAYHLYTDEDLAKKLIYVEASRGCAFNCDFCLSAIDSTVREFPLDHFLSGMDILIQRGVKTFKFLDRSININIKRTIQICEFFLDKIENLSAPPRHSQGLVVHFEMVPSIFPHELLDVLFRFPPGTLRLEIGIQTFNSEVAARIGRISKPEKEQEALCLLRQKTGAIIHADLIAGLPGEDLVSFGKGFDRLWSALSGGLPLGRAEIQLGILKLLPGAPLSRHNETFGMRYNSRPPYEVLETSVMSEDDLNRIKNFSRFWELIVNRGLLPEKVNNEWLSFDNFLNLSDKLFSCFGRNWGIDKAELLEAVSGLTGK